MMRDQFEASAIAELVERLELELAEHRQVDRPGPSAERPLVRLWGPRAIAPPDAPRGKLKAVLSAKRR